MITIVEVAHSRLRHGHLTTPLCGAATGRLNTPLSSERALCEVLFGTKVDERVLMPKCVMRILMCVHTQKNGWVVQWCVCPGVEVERGGHEHRQAAAASWNCATLIRVLKFNR
jgi:hypothetical protein